MTTLTNNAEGGTNGTTVTTGNSGGASGNAFDVVTIGTNAALTFDNTHVAHGTLAYDVTTPSVATSSYVSWTTSMGTQSQVWFRMYGYFTANPGATFRWFTAVSGASNCGSLQVTTTGKLQWINSASATILTSTASIPLNTWFRVEGFIVGSATVGQVQVSLYTTPDGLTAVETDTSAATQNTLSTMTGYRFGLSGSTANIGPFWIDDLGLSSTGPLGPAYSLAPAQGPVIPRRVPARSVIGFKQVTTTNGAGATVSAGPATGVLPYAGGVTVQSFSQVFTASGSWTAPPGIIGPPAVYAWGPSGTAATGTAGTGAGGGGGGAIGGEPSLGGVTAGTVLTVTVGAAGSGNPTTVTGGSVTVQGNAGGNASIGTGGAAGTAGSNTVAFAGGTGGNGAAGGSGGGGGGGASAGSTGAGGNGSPGSGTTGGNGGTAGTGTAGLTGAAGGNGGTASNGTAGNAPGGAGGGGSGGATHTGGAATAGQVVIIWQVVTPVLMAMPRRKPARAWTPLKPVTSTAAAAISGQVQPRPTVTAPRRTPARAYIQFTPVRTTNAAPPPFVPAQQFRTAPRRTPARAYIQFTPVRTTNAAPAVVPPSIPPAIPTSGGDRGYTIRVFREIRPGDVPTLGAQLPKLTGRSFAMPVAADVEHVTHAWEAQPEDEPVVPSGPGLAEQVRAELDELTQAARDAAAAIDRAADRARPVVEALGSKAYDLGKIFGNTPYDPRPRKVCGATRMTGGVVLTCQRKPHDDGWHSDKGLHWR